ncbi:hypothetical protein DT076_10835 [Desertihabitans brevis]|uniref:Uncharacterized protein n=1 Tax=Desertihabitans brevis TaxID=2268447 RepID=A0A367YWQ8_9ACTN|nr:hypothetical protein [Desertihabitans brevis]RCK69381.1 hypothetical protein DT076_10835 [Desertihabitans brevis]
MTTGTATPRPRRLAGGAGAAVLLSTVLAVVGLVVMDDRTGGLGLAVVLVPVGLVAVAVGIAGWALLRATTAPVGAARTVLGLVLAAGAVGVLLLIALSGFSAQPGTGA